MPLRQVGVQAVGAVEVDELLQAGRGRAFLNALEVDERVVLGGVEVDDAGSVSGGFSDRLDRAEIGVCWCRNRRYS